jgi:uncharacterized delta-60 repeat protein
MRRAAPLASDLLLRLRYRRNFPSVLLSMLPVLSSRSFARRFLPLWVSFVATTAALLAQSPSANDGFDPNVDGNVYVVATQADGRIVVGGQFTSVRPNGALVPTLRNNLARFNADGSVDASFDPNPNGPVRAIVIQPDGAILIGGDFTAVQVGGPTGTPLPRKLVARLTAAGAVDTTFATSFDGAILPQVYALALQANGSIVVGGNFTSVQPAGAATATARRNLARVSSTGAIEAFDPSPNSIVLALALHAGGKIVVGGGFTSFQENGRTTTTTRNHIARLNVDGTVDADFDPNANNGVTALAVQPDGKIVVGGYFSTLQTVGWSTPVQRNHIARLEADGTLDVGFETNTAGNVMAVAVQPDGGVLVGGAFTAIWSKGSPTMARSFLARFTSDGTVDTAFSAGLNGQVAALAVQADGKAVVGGYFTRMFPVATPNTGIVTRNRLARIQGNGEIDTTFQLIDSGRPLASAVQADGKLIIGGSFTSIGGTTHNSLARLNVDGSVDPAYVPDINGRVLALVLQPDGKLLVGGMFTSVNGVTRNRLARLNADGTLDTTFDPNVDGTVGAIALQSDGKIVIGGAFTSLQPAGTTAATLRGHVARLTAAGQVDTPFDPNADNIVSAIIVLSDGKIILGGAFTSFAPNGSTVSTGRSRIARVNSDGTLDSAFNISLSDHVSAMVLQGDGKVVLGGAFTQVLPSGATTAITRNHILRLSADGTLDTAYDPNANGNVLALALQSDGKLVVGGTFTTFTPNGASAANWILRKYVARLNVDGTPDPAFNLDVDETPGNRVDSIRVLADGRILLGGNFASLQPIGATARVARQNFARLSAAGALDQTFTISATGTAAVSISAIALQADGKIVATGTFSDLGGAKTVNIARFSAAGLADASFGTTLSTDGPVNAVAVRPNAATSSSQLAGFAWLNANGTLRAAFAPGSNVRLSGQVRAVAVQPNGSVLLGGVFANLTNVTNGNLLRFSAAGALDTSFNPAINGQVSAIAVQSDGKIVIGGNFTTVNNIVRNHIARLNADGSLDTVYDPNANAAVVAIALQADGKAIIAGDFITVQPNAAIAVTARNYIARLNTDGTVDTVFNPFPSANVSSVLVQPDGKVVFAGFFTTVAPGASTTSVIRNAVARVNADGSLDTTFDPNFNGAVTVMRLQPNGDILLGGAFTSLEPTVNGTKITGFPATNIARIHSDSSVDRTFFPVTNGAVNALALQPNGQIVIGGVFTTVQGTGASSAVTRNHAARLNSDGSLDVAFNPDVAGAVYAVGGASDNSVFIAGDFTGLQGSGLLLIGGSFTNVGGVTAPYLALLNDDGSVNSSFLPSPNGAITHIVILPDGRFVVAGAFTNIAGVARSRIARFNADGTLDTSFAPPAPITPVGALALQPDGKLLAGVGAGVTRYNTNGTIDPTFAPVVFHGVINLAVQPDGRVVYVMHDIASTEETIGRFTADGALDPTFQNLVTGGVRALALQSDGRILVAARLPGVGIPQLLRLNSTGSIDATFNPQPNDWVSAIAVQNDGRLVIGGTFTSVGGLPRVGLARLAAPTPAINMLGVSADRTAVVWSRGGGSAELTSVTFELSSDQQTWTSLGTGRRAAGAFVLTGLNLPASGNFSIRARGIAPAGGGVASSVQETVRQFNFASSLYAAPVATPVPPAGTPAGQAFVGVNPFTGLIVGAVPTAVGSGGVTPSTEGSAQIPVDSAARLVNISTRARVASDAPVIIGFAINGTTSQTLLLRAVGPSLARFGVDGVAARPQLRLFDASGAVILENSSWTTAPGVAEAAVRTGAFAFDDGSTQDAAALVTLAPGTYSMHVLTRDGTAGIALAEIYEAGTAEQSAGARLVNLSSRGVAGVGGEAFIGGFVISGTSSKSLLVRGIGPTLARYGVTAPLADPMVSVYDADNHLVATNDNWSNLATDGLITPSTAALIAQTSASGAFSLDVGSKDAALSTVLAPGAYTVHVRGVDGGSGAAMIELYTR